MGLESPFRNRLFRVVQQLSPVTFRLQGTKKFINRHVETLRLANDAIDIDFVALRERLSLTRKLELPSSHFLRSYDNNLKNYDPKPETGDEYLVLREGACSAPHY